MFERVTVFIWPSSSGMHVEERLSAHFVHSLLVFSLMSNFLPFVAIIASVDFYSLIFFPRRRFFPPLLSHSTSTAFFHSLFYPWRCVHMCVVLICWLAVLCPPYNIPSINYLLPTFYQLNVSNKVNLCAFKYMQNANFSLCRTESMLWRGARDNAVCAREWWRK